MNRNLSRFLRVLAGIVAGCAAGALLCVLVGWLSNQLSPSNDLIAIYPSLFIIPFLMGVVASVVWRGLGMGAGQMALYSLFFLAFTLVGGAIAFHEGVICLVIVSPLFYLCLFLGALAGSMMYGSDRSKLQVSLVPLLVVAALVEPMLRREVTGVVTDEVLIHAPPAKVWPHVVEFPPIQEAPRFWLFKMGLPMPMATTCAGEYVGADRKCIFSGGAVFDEKVAVIVPGEKLVFDIVDAPKDPELLGHLDLKRGEFELQDNHDGTTTLVGHSWYALKVRPVWYFDWWTHAIFGAVHARVMEHIRALSEADGEAAKR